MALIYDLSSCFPASGSNTSGGSSGGGGGGSASCVLCPNQSLPDQVTLTLTPLPADACLGASSSLVLTWSPGDNAWLRAQGTICLRGVSYKLICNSNGVTIYFFCDNGQQSSFTIAAPTSCNPFVVDFGKVLMVDCIENAVVNIIITS